MTKFREWWESLPIGVRLHGVYSLLLTVLMLFMGLMQAMHHAEVVRLKAAADEADRKAQEAAHSAKAAETARQQAEALQAAQAAQAAAQRNLTAAQAAQTTANTRAAAIRGTTGWDDLNKMAGVK